jgi:hypothetical protein
VPLRSHVDLCLFIRLIRAQRENISVADIDDLEHAQDQERALRLWRAQFNADPMVWFHEHYHYWQGLRLPFLFWYAAYSLRAVFTGFRDFLQTGEPFENWSGDAPMLGYLSLKMRCIYSGEDCFAIGFESAAIPANCLFSATLSPLDLIEGMTSIAEWQVQASGAQLDDVRSFQRWSKRNPAYLDALRFTAGVVQDESLALRIFCPLVEAAFHTSQPVRGFLKLLGFFYKFRTAKAGKDFIAQREPCRWQDVFRDMLQQMKFEAPPDSLKGVFINHPFCLLNRGNWVGGSWSGSSFLHPFLTPNARKWIEKEKEMPAYSWLLCQLGWAPDEVFWDAFDTFYPPVNILHFALKDGTNRIILGGHPDATAEGFLKSGNFITLLTAFSVVRRATETHFNSEIRLCHHSDCPHYAKNYCNLYPVIPQSWEKCGFPWRVEEISKVLRSGGQVLV